MGTEKRPFCYHQNFIPDGLFAPARGYWKNMKKRVEIVLKLATNGQSDKGFYVDINICPQGIVCPCPGAIYMYKRH